MKQFLPIVIPLEDHELLYSYVERLAKVNLYDNRAELIRAFAGPAYFHKDGFGYTQHLFNAAGFGEKMHNMYLNHTLNRSLLHSSPRKSKSNFYPSNALGLFPLLVK